MENKENKSLFTDLYELIMAQTYFDNDKLDEEVYFDLFFRKNPFNGGYTITNGLDNIIDYLKNFRFKDKHINYLRSLNRFSEPFLNHLKEIRFTGDLYAIPDGTPVFPNEPVMTVKANIIEAQLIETALLANFNHGSLVTTIAKRIVNEAGVPVMEFGARRARGIESACDASKYAYIAGCVGTSNVQAGMENNIPVLGTMAHSLVTEAETEYEAFMQYAVSNPNNCTFLVDTYDTLRSGIPNAIRVAQDLGIELKGIRIDSGDLAYLSKEARKLLDEAGFENAKICLSNGLDEYTIADLLKQGAKVDSFGIGDNIAASKERVGGVYKLVGATKEGIIVPKIKLSNDGVKTTTPGYKKVYRFFDKASGYARGDLIALADEQIPLDEYTLIHPTEDFKKTTINNYTVRELQVPIFRNGQVVYNEPTIEEKREYCKNEFETIYPEVKRLLNPHGYYVDLSERLRNLKRELIELNTNNQEEKGFQKVLKCAKKS